MATPNSIFSISKLLRKTFLSVQKSPFNSNSLHLQFPKFFTSLPSDLDDPLNISSDSDSATESTPTESPPEPTRRRGLTDTVLEGGLDIGIYKAIIVGQVGQSPLKKRLKNGRMVTLTTVGTGGIRNERIPFPNEEPREYADRCNVQWHRVAVYPEGLGEIVMKHAQPGSILYLEGNLETKIFTDQITGLVRRVREIAVRQNGRVVFLSNDSNFNQPSPTELKGIGYF